jgi:hypothetical protein
MRPLPHQIEHDHHDTGATDQHHHPHHHPHPHPAVEPVVEPANIGAGQGAVLLDIGEGVGALVLYTGPGMLNTEIEISPAGQDDRRTHVAVLARPGQHPPLHAAVYPTLDAGRWTLWDPATGKQTLTVTINDGGITEARWPGPPTSGRHGA